MSTEATRTANPPDGGTASHLPDPDATAPPPSDADATASPTQVPPPPHPHDPPPGFEFVSWIARGGMGAVYLARQVGLNRLCAIKLVAAADPKSLIRFLAEAELVAAIRHPNVVEVYQYGEHCGHPYLALEYCPGGDLSQLVNRKAKTSAAGDFRRVAELMAGVADGVQAAHTLNIIHRDLKPGNVLLASDGTPKVADFGLAKRGAGSDLTRTQAIMGTPAYMSPEQASGGTKFVGPESDVWALGVMLYELCGGTRPFTGDGPMEVLAAVTKGDFAPLQKVCPTVPRDLALIVTKCLQRDAKDRYPTAGPLAADLRSWLEGKPISARPAGMIEQAAKWAKRNKRLAVMGLAVFLTMATATAVSLAFGLETDKQAGIARQKQQDAEKATERAEKEVEKTQRTLAKALLGPMAGYRQHFDLSEYELGAIWSATAERRGRVPLLLLEEATSTELGAAQLRGRGRYLVHALVGLDTGERRRADELFGRRLRDASFTVQHRRDLALAVVDGERFNSARVAAEILAVTLGQIKGDERGEVAVGLALLAEQLPADEAATVCGPAAESLATALKRTTDVSERRRLAVALVAVAQQLPAEQRAGMCGDAAEEMIAALRKEVDWYRRREIVGGLVEVCQQLPADEAAKVCGQAVFVLANALNKTTDAFKHRDFAAGMAVIAQRLPTEDAATACGDAAEVLTTHLTRTTEWYAQRELVAGLAAVAQRLPPDRAAAACYPAVELLVETLGKETRAGVRKELATGLAALARWLPADAAAKVCGPAATALQVALGTAPRGERRALAEGLAAVAQWVPVGLAEEVCGPAAELLAADLRRATDRSEQQELAVGIAALAQRLSEDRATAVCSVAVSELTAAIASTSDLDERTRLAVGVAALARWIPAEHAADALTPALAEAASTDSHERLAAGLAAAAQRLPTNRAVAVLTPALGRAKSVVEWQTLAGGLSAVTGLPNQQCSHLKHPTEFVALLGVATLHPDVLPRPRPLPPQQLVELLKHPFCVKEARRAVLDALEFTYDRKFADLWEFVAFAEKEHPELDLLTPPKRPTK